MGEDDTGTGWKALLKVAGIVLVAGALLAALPWVLPRIDLDTDGLLWASLIGLAFGALLFYAGFRAYRKRQLIRDTPTSKIRSLAIGTAEIQGAAEPLTEPLVSPLTHTPACMYELKVEERKKVRKNKLGLGSDDDPHKRKKKREWKTVLTIRENVPFCIDDGTGRVPVRADEAELSIAVEEKAKVGKRDPPPEALQQWADEHGPSQGGMPSLPGRLGEMVDQIQAGKTKPEEIDPSEFTPEGFDPETDDPEQLDPDDVKLAGVLSKDAEGGPSEGGSGSLLGSVGEMVEAGAELMQQGGMSGSDRYLTSSTRNKRRFTERVLGAGEQAYVFGSAQRLPDADSIENVENLVIREDPTTGQFLVSDKSPSRLLDDKLVRAALFLSGGTVLVAYSLMGLAVLAGAL